MTSNSTQIILLLTQYIGYAIENSGTHLLLLVLDPITVDNLRLNGAPNIKK